MAGFRKDRTGVAQTAANNAGTVVAALVTAGVITDIETAKSEFASIQESIYAVLGPVVDADNELFAKVDAETPAAKPRGGSSGGSKSTGSSTITVEEARGCALGFGKFGSKDDEGKANGVTLGELEGFTKSQCEEYEYTSGNGIKYLEYLAKNENNDFMARRAKVILEARKATSDAE